MTIFEKIIAREIPAYIIDEDELSIAFLDITQATKGHTLVVPKVAYRDLFAIPDDVLQHLILKSKKISSALCESFDAKGINWLHNTGKEAGQTVFHFHIHLIPRYTAEEMHFFHETVAKLSKETFLKRQQAIIKKLDQ